MPKFSTGFRVLSSEVRGLQSAVYILASFAFLSSLLALFRDRLLASHFGAGVELDLYYAAFRIPDFLFVALGALVSVYMLIPELTRRDSSSQKSYIDTVLIGFSFIAVAIGLFAVVLAPKILSVLFPKFVEAGLLDTLTMLTRIMLFQPIILGFSNIFAAITQTRYRYVLYAASPVFYNVGIILGITVFFPLWGLPGLAWGVVFGAALHAGIQIPPIIRDGFLNTFPRFREPHALLRTVSSSIPRALALSMNQITFIGLTVLASTLTAGSIAVFMLAFNLQAVPLAIIGASYSVAAFPTLALSLSNGRRDEFIAHIATAARHVLFWSLPATALIIVLRAHIVRVVLGSGAFDWTDTRLTAAAFAILSLSLVFQGLLLLLVRGYYAAGRTFIPLFVSSLITIGTVGLGVALLALFENPAALPFLETLLRVENAAGSNVLALAFAYAFSTFVGTVILAILFERKFAGFFRGIKRSLAQSMVAAFTAGVTAYLTLYLIGPLTLTSTLLSVFIRGFSAGALGIIAAAIVYRLLHNSEYLQTAGALHAKLWRGTVKSESGVTLVASAEEATELK